MLVAALIISHSQREFPSKYSGPAANLVSPFRRELPSNLYTFKFPNWMAIYMNPTINLTVF